MSSRTWSSGSAIVVCGRARCPARFELGDAMRDALLGLDGLSELRVEDDERLLDLREIHRGEPDPLLGEFGLELLDPGTQRLRHSGHLRQFGTRAHEV